jgi:hypothetical protein
LCFVAAGGCIGVFGARREIIFRRRGNPNTATSDFRDVVSCTPHHYFVFVDRPTHIILPKILREFIEGLDLFVGRYLVLVASGYIIVKVIHFKVFPDFP